MKVTIATANEKLYLLEISEELELENFKVFCEIKSGLSSSEMILFHEGKPLIDDKKSLKCLGVRDGDVILVQTNAGNSCSGVFSDIDFGQIQIPEYNMENGLLDNFDDKSLKLDIDYLVNNVLRNSDQLSALMQNNPQLADALLNGDYEHIGNVLRQQEIYRRLKKQEMLRLLNANPLDVDTQRLIAEEIRQNNIDANMEAAMEYSPESFVIVSMLYINCKVNGHPVKAFIDSGAQTTIMSSACAERCNIMRLVDTRWAGIAKGIGTQKIFGRVHVGQIQIENDFLPSSFSIIEDQPMDMLLGLDMLKRHQCCIDLKNNVLVIGTTGTKTKFLSERELPECSRLQFSGENSRSRKLDSQCKPRFKCGADSPSFNPTYSCREEDLQKIISLGFARKDALAELEKFQGNTEQAIASLLAKSLTMKK